MYVIIWCRGSIWHRIVAFPVRSCMKITRLCSCTTFTYRRFLLTNRRAQSRTPKGYACRQHIWHNFDGWRTTDGWVSVFKSTTNEEMEIASQIGQVRYFSMENFRESIRVTYFHLRVGLGTKRGRGAMIVEFKFNLSSIEQSKSRGCDAVVMKKNRSYNWRLENWFCEKTVGLFFLFQTLNH